MNLKRIWEECECRLKHVYINKVCRFLRIFDIWYIVHWLFKVVKIPIKSQN